MSGRCGGNTRRSRKPSAVAIRMAVKKGNKVYVQAGAGIVADSDPKSEYLETYNKALAVINAVKNAGEVEAI